MLLTGYVITLDESKEIDILAQREYKIPDLVMMEEAASGLFNSIKEDFKNLKSKNVAVVAGPGNNGGDALALARKMVLSGYRVDVYMFQNKKGSNLFNLQLDIITNIKASVYPMSILATTIGKYEIIIDGLFGIGYKHRDDCETEAIFECINNRGKRTKVISIDIPSGLTNKELISVRADYTYTIGFYKDVFYSIYSRKYVGKIKKIMLSSSYELLKKDEHIYKIEYINSLEKENNDFIHKYSKGGVLSIGGSIGKLGSIVFTSESALNAGAGISLVLTDNNALQPLCTLTKRVIFDSIDKINDYIKKYNTVVIGPGLEISGENKVNLYKIFSLQKTFILDASFFSFFEKEDIKKFSNPPLLTPHTMEFIRFFGIDDEIIKSETIQIVKKIALQYNCYILLKDSFIIYALPDGRVYIYDNPSSMAAQAGSGDILSGIIAGKAAKLNNVETAVFEGLRIFYSIINKYKDKKVNNYNHDDFINQILKS